MNWQNIHTQQLAENIGWTLIHSLWQISLVAFLLFCSLRIFKNASANARYLLSVAALFTTVAMAAATFVSFMPGGKIGAESGSAAIDANAPKSSINESGGKNAPVKVLTDFQGAATMDENRAKDAGDGLGSRAGEFLKAALPFVAWLWLSGVMVFSFRFCGGIRQVIRIRKRGVSCTGEEWQAKFDELREKTGVRRAAQFLQSELIKTPMVTGWIKPLVIIPSSVLLNLNPRELETIIAHELIHIRRHDYLVNILQSFVEIVLFFHPLTWWISAQIRRERENVCDDEVLKVIGGAPLLYANALANLEDFRAKSLTPLNMVAANGGDLKMRIQRIIKRGAGNNDAGEPFRLTLPALLFFAAFLTGVLATGWYLAIGRNEVMSERRTNKIAVGLSSGTVVLPSANSAEEDEEIMQIIVSKLKEHNIPTTGFLKGVDFKPPAETMYPAQEQIVSLWQEAGFEIGVLDLKYPQSFNATTGEYQKALQEKEEKLAPLLEKQMPLFKELKSRGTQKSSGKDMNVAMRSMEAWRKGYLEAIKGWLRENNLTNVKYTFGADDWMYSIVYDVARKNNDRAMMNQIKNAYIDYMSRMLDHYESYAQQIFGRRVPQTLPLAPSRLLADSADELFTMIEKRNYRFISLDDAMRDEIYQSDFLYFNQIGGSWLLSGDLQREKLLPTKPEIDADTKKLFDDYRPANLVTFEK